MNRKNKGFTLVEMIIVVSIFTILLGILVPSVTSVFAFRAQRAANSIAAALDRTKTEASNRLVGEMKLEKKSDGYYISYYFDRGLSNTERVTKDEPEKIASANTLITICTTNNPEGSEMQPDDYVILTYDRENGGFRPVQSDVMTQEEINTYLQECRDIPFKDDDGNYCTQIIVKGGYRTRTLELNKDTGSYTIKAG